MAYVGVGETSALGYLPNDGHVFINVYARLKRTHNPELHIKTAHPHYLIQRFIDANTFQYERHIDNCFKVPRDDAKEFLEFARPINEELEELRRRVKLLDKTVSEDVDVADLDSFHSRMWKCHELIDDEEMLKYQMAYHFRILAIVTEWQQLGIRGHTSWKICETTRFSITRVRHLYYEYEECHKHVVIGRLKLFNDPQGLPEHLILHPLEYSPKDLRAHYNIYSDLLTQLKITRDLLAVEKKFLKVAIGKADSVPGLFSWSRKRVNRFRRTTFRRRYPNLYHDCLEYVDPKWKCEILPFRG